MTISPITEGDHARVSFAVDNTQAKQAVEASLPRLRSGMEEAGVYLSGAEVVDRDSKESNAQSDEQATNEDTTDLADDEDGFDDSKGAANRQLIDTFA